MAYSFDPQIIARLLTGIGASASAYGAGSPQWGYAGVQAMDQQAQAAQMRAQQNLQNQLTQQQIQRQQQADADAAAQKAAAKSWLIGQSAPSGLYDGQGRPGPSTATPAALDSIPEAHRSFYQSYANIDPIAAAQMAGQEMLKDPEKPDLQDFDEGGNVVKKQWDPKTNTWISLSTAPRWQPPAPPQIPGDYQIYLAEKKADPTIKSYSAWKQSQSTPKQPGITTLYDPQGNAKSFYDNDPGIKGMLESGWSAAKPEKAATTYGDLITGPQAQALGLDPNGTYQKDSSGKYVAVVTPKTAATTFKTVTGDDAKTLGLDPAKTWSVASTGEAKVIDKPDSTDRTTREKEALAAGLVDGSPEFKQYVLSGKTADSQAGVFDTKNLTGQAYNILLNPKSDATSPEYAAAWNIVAQPKVQYLPDGTTNTFSPDMTPFRKPTYTGPVDTPADQSQAAPQPSEVPAENAQMQKVPGGTIGRVQGGYQTPADIQKLKEIKSEVGSIRDSLENFRKIVNSAPETDFLAANAGGFTEGSRKLSSAWSAAALQLKSQALLNLGVLNGPDLQLIQGMLPNPSTVGGALASKKAYAAAIDQIVKMIDQKVNAYTQQYGPKNPQAPAAPSPDDLEKKYGLQ